MCVVAAAVAGGVATAGAGAAISGITGSGGGGSQQAASAADPFAGQRPQYQQMLSNLINNPSSVSSTPGYQYQMQQALLGVEGSAAANGMLNSGNVLSALTTQAGNQASTGYYNQAELLAALAGANVGSPGTAGQILQGQNAINQQGVGALASNVGQGVQSLAGNYFSTPSYSGGDPFAGSSGYGVGGNTYGFSGGVPSDGSYGVSYGGSPTYGFGT